MSFQDDLIRLFDNCSVASPEAFEKLAPHPKSYFINRLYALFDKGLSHLGEELSSVRGLKIHYNRDAREKGFVPPRLEDTFYKKLAFYTSRCVVSCPISEVSSDAKPSKSKRLKNRIRYDSATLGKIRAEGKVVFGKVKAQRRTHGGEIHIEGKSYIVEKSAIVDLIGTVVGLRQGIVSQAVYVLPSLPGREAQLRAALRKGQTTPGNFRRDELVRQFTEDGLQYGNALVDAGLTSIYLPHLSQVSLPELIEFRERNSDAYTEFQVAIDSFLTHAGNAVHDSESAILSLLQQVDEGVRRIAGQLKLLKKKRLLRNAEAGIELAALGLVAFLPPEYRTALAGVVGSITATEVLKSNRELQEEYSTVTAEPFYLAWKVQDLR